MALHCSRVWIKRIGVWAENKHNAKQYTKPQRDSTHLCAAAVRPSRLNRRLIVALLQHRNTKKSFWCFGVSVRNTKAPTTSVWCSAVCVYNTITPKNIVGEGMLLLFGRHVFRTSEGAGSWSCSRLWWLIGWRSSLEKLGIAAAAAAAIDLIAHHRRADERGARRLLFHFRVPGVSCCCWKKEGEAGFWPWLLCRRMSMENCERLWAGSIGGLKISEKNQRLKIAKSKMLQQG